MSPLLLAQRHKNGREKVHLGICYSRVKRCFPQGLLRQWQSEALLRWLRQGEGLPQ